MSQAVIELDSVTKRFGKHAVLDKLTLNIEQGRTFAFLGRNGAGKTTTIRLLLGLLRRNEGAIRIFGVDPATHGVEVRKRVGYLAEDQAMYGWMKVDEIIRFAAPFYPSWDHDLARQYAAQFELPLQARVKTLSKGQNVRLGLLLALAHRPELVVLDDPALGLDPIMRKEFNRDLITHLQGEGRTVFYSSHLLYEVEPVADEIAILDGGCIRKQAATESLREEVKQFVLSEPAYNSCREKLRVLDLRRADTEVAVSVEDGPRAAELLEREGIPHRTVDLNLDEIFEAYVSGNPERTEPVSDSDTLALADG